MIRARTSGTALTALTLEVTSWVRIGPATSTPSTVMVGAAGSVPETMTGLPAAVGDRRRVVDVDAVVHHPPGDRPVLGAGVQVAQAELGGDGLGGARLARAGGAVDGDDHCGRGGPGGGFHGGDTFLVAVVGGCWGDATAAPHKVTGARRRGPHRRCPGTAAAARTRPDPAAGLYCRIAQPRSRSAAVSTGAADGSTISCTRPACWPVACSIRTSSMLTPARPASAKIRASSPGWSPMSTATISYAAGAAPCLPGTRTRPGVAAAQHVLDAVGALAALGLVGGLQGAQRPHRLVEVGGDLGEHVGDRARVGGEDVDPHPRGRRRRSGSRPGCPARTAVRRPPRRPPGGRRPCWRPGAGMCETSATARSWASASMTTGTARQSETSSRARFSTSVSVSRVGVSTQGRPSKRSAVAASGPDCSRPDIGCVPMYADEVEAERLQLAARAALDAGDVEVAAGDPAPHRVGEHRGHMRGRHGDDREVDRALGRLVGAGAERGRRTGLLRVVVGEVDDDAAPGQGERGGGADQAGSDDECGSHWAMSLRRAAAAPRYGGAILGHGRAVSDRRPQPRPTGEQLPAGVSAARADRRQARDGEPAAGMAGSPLSLIGVAHRAAGTATL